MKISLYQKLAWEGIQKNKQLYIPYIVTGCVMVMMYYIISFLAATEMLEHMRGGGILRTILPLGAIVIVVFSFFFLLYSNSLLTRQRNREFGLYNVLGMDKGNLGRIIFWENLIVAVFSIIIGLLLGIGLAKIAELGMLNLIKEEISYKLRIDVATAGKAIGLFACIYVCLLINSIVKVYRSKPVELLQSSNVGEKPPKANWLLAIVGIILLSVAYYIAVSIKQPLTALLWFLFAVVLVIIATYLLFIAGSVALCRILQKNKKYYYKPQHFISVSTMVYRMKRNGAGLASICVLITMVLVMLSATISLYIGAEDSLATRYPKDIEMSISVPGIEYFNEESFSHMRTVVKDKVSEQEDIVEYAEGYVYGLFTEEGMIIDTESHVEFDITTYENVGMLSIIALDDYNKLMGTNKELEADECLIYGYNTEYINDTFSIQGGLAINVKEVLDEFYISGATTMHTAPTLFLIIDNFEEVVEPLIAYNDSYGNPLLEFYWNYGFDMDVKSDEEIAVYEKLWDEIHDITIPIGGSYSYMLDGKEYGRAEFYGMYGGLFFIGILLSIALIFAAVIIIYYKQITEGFEDKKRFEVMQNVGMTQVDIRKSINSQVLTIFFAPLLLAGLHLAFAFPIVWRMLQMFNFSNLHLMVVVTLCCYLVFAGVYSLVYKITSNSYYTIVSR